MKKGFVFLMLSLMLVSIGFVDAAVQCPNDGAWTDTECVCGYIPNSTLGYGQVIIGSVVYSCNNVADGLCPEDYIDTETGLVASCGLCGDPDCTGRISGLVTDEQARPIDRVTITGGPLSYNPNTDLTMSELTQANGRFNGTFLTGWNYTILFSKDSFTTRTMIVTVERNKETVIPPISLPNGTCNEDCTNVYGTCSAECDGVEFEEAAKVCRFYTGEWGNTVKEKCNNKPKGTEVFLGWNGTNQGVFIQCCGDDPITNPREQPYQKYYASLNGSTTTCVAKNVVKVEKIARYQNVPVRVIITYWDE